MRKDEVIIPLTDRWLRGTLRGVIVFHIPAFIVFSLFLFTTNFLSRQAAVLVFFCIAPVFFFALYGWFSRLFFRCPNCKRTAYKVTLRAKLLGPWGFDWYVERCQNCGAGFKLFYEPKSALPKDENAE